MNMISSDRLEAFAAIQRQGSFSKAAKSLNITQSALSQRIAKLELELGEVLFIRDQSGARFTDAGRELWKYCLVRKDLDQTLLQRFHLRSGEEERGTIRVAAYSSVLRSVVLPALANLTKAHPNVRLEVSSRELRELPALLENGEVDYVVRNQFTQRPDLDEVKLGIEENVHIRPKGRARRKNTFLDHDPDDSTTFDYFRMQGESSPKFHRLYLDDIYGIIDGVRLGIGEAIVSRHLVRRNRDIVVVKGEPLVNPVVLSYYSKPFYSGLHDQVRESLIAASQQILAGSRSND